MAYDIEIRDLAPRPTLTQSATTTQDRIGAELGRILPAVWQQIEAAGAHPAGPPFARYYAWTPEGVQFEAGLPVTTPVGRAQEGFAAGELPGGPAACTVHVGPYDGIHAAYEAIEAFLAGEGRAASGAPWEVYLTDPGEEPDASKWRTEVFWPLG